MKTRVVFVLAAATLLLAGSAQAATYYLRNKPFLQVYETRGEAMVGTEAFLRALGLNWSLDGTQVTLTEKPASNPTLPNGSLTFKYGKDQAQLELTPHGGAAYTALRPLAKLTGYAVRSNTLSGTVDVNKARFATDEEQKLAGQLEGTREEEQKAIAEAWKKKAEQLKKEREDKNKTEEEKAKEAEQQATPAQPEKSENDKALEDVQGRLKKLETPPPPAAALETLSADATPDPASGTVEIKCVVRNIGNAASTPVSGVLVLKGPDNSKSASDNVNRNTRVYLRKSLSGPPIQPDKTWQITEKYTFPGGNSMPIGNWTAEFTLNKTK